MLAPALYHLARCASRDIRASHYKAAACDSSVTMHVDASYLPMLY